MKIDKNNKQISKNKIKELTLNKEEERIEKDLEKGDYVSRKDLQETKKLFNEAVKNFKNLQKSKSITLRVNQQDLLKLKTKAKKRNIPYQTLLNVLIHQYAEDETNVRL